MIKSSESSGDLDRVAGQLAQHYDKEYRLNQKVKSSMTYPKILSVLIVVVVIIIVAVVVFLLMRSTRTAKAVGGVKGKGSKSAKKAPAKKTSTKAVKV